MRTLIMMVGAPGSGKSYLAQEMAKYEEMDGYSTVIISRDEVRKNLLDSNDGYFDKERKVFNLFAKDINDCLEIGVARIYMDATHINRKSRAKILRKLALSGTKVRLVVVVMNSSKELCKNRNNLRTGFAHVPDSAIDDMFARYEEPTKQEFKDYGFYSITITHYGAED